MGANILHVMKRALTTPWALLLLIFSSLAFSLTWVCAPSNTYSGTMHNLSSSSSISRQIGPKLFSSSRLTPELRPGNLEASTELRIVYQPRELGQVVLTFDDGPHHLWTAKLLEVLRRHQVKATFFVNGYWLNPPYPHWEVNRQILKQIVADGHTIGNHTVNHALLKQLDIEEQRDELLVNERLIENITGQRTHLFRPPFASLPASMHELLIERRYIDIRFSAGATESRTAQPRQLKEQLMGWLRAYNGGIVIMHDLYRSSVEAIDLLLTELPSENERRRENSKLAFQVVGIMNAAGLE